MSRFRISGGQAKGRILQGPLASGVRPTSSRVREALFSMVGQDLSETRFLDAFGGSGLMGLEAWSRGADVVVVEQRRNVAAELKVRGQQVDASWQVVVGDVCKCVQRLGAFDGIFMDPPYALDPMPLLERLAPYAKAWLVLETQADTQVPAAASELSLDTQRNYGSTTLSIYR